MTIESGDYVIAMRTTDDKLVALKGESPESGDYVLAVKTADDKLAALAFDPINEIGEVGCIARTADNELIGLGEGFPGSATIWKLSIDGALITRFDTGGTVRDIAVDSEGNIYVVGDHHDSANLWKYDSLFNLLWDIDTGGGVTRGIAVNSEDDVVVIGHADEGHYFVWKYDSDGNKVWEVRRQQGANWVSEGLAIAISVNDDICVGFQWATLGFSGYAWLDTDGNSIVPADYTVELTAVAIDCSPTAGIAYIATTYSLWKAMRQAILFANGFWRYPPDPEVAAYAIKRVIEETAVIGIEHDGARSILRLTGDPVAHTVDLDWGFDTGGDVHGVTYNDSTAYAVGTRNNGESVWGLEDQGNSAVKNWGYDTGGSPLCVTMASNNVLLVGGEQVAYD